MFNWILSLWSFLFGTLSRECIEVSSFRDLVDAVESAESKVLFCPFAIDKEESASLVISSAVDIECSWLHLCILRGPGNHISVEGNNARLRVSKFVFSGATDHAIQIDASASNSQGHTISQCEFLDNVGAARLQRGGAIDVGAGTTVSIVDSRFEGNAAGFGGAVVHAGKRLSLQEVRFDGNVALRGGAIYVTSTAQQMNLTNTYFVENVANETRSGAVSAENIANVQLLRDGIWQGTDGVDNYGCNGVYDGKTQKCIPFRGTGPAPAPVRPPSGPSAPSASNFVLGNLSSALVDGLKLSEGLSARLIARKGERVPFTSPEATASASQTVFHSRPDGADVFALPDGGYVYVGNAELFLLFGGVYGVEFDAQGRVRDYKRLLKGTIGNCNGGRTPWNTWVSCEEVPGGQCWQVDPTGVREPEATAMGGISGGKFEAFAYDIRNASSPRFFVTEDSKDGALRRYTPAAGRARGWNMLHGEGGTIEYLEILPDNRFRWTDDRFVGKDSAELHYRNSEGIAVQNGKLAFVSKVQKELFTLDLDKLTYTVVSTQTAVLPGGGSFDDQPDHVIAMSGGMMLLSEDGGPTPGLYAYDGSKYLTFFESNFADDEVVGIAFSPDRKYMFVAVQEIGYLYQVWRTDGQLFEARRVLKWRTDTN